MSKRLEGKVAFITGAARGQRRSHAVRFAEEGADIIAIDVCKELGMVPYAMPTPDDLAETEDLVKARNRRIVTAEIDVRDFDTMKRFVDSAVEQLGRLDIIIANAGIGIVGTTLHEVDETRWQDMIDINLTGGWKSVKAGVGHIANSVAGLKAHPNVGHYVAAKHGVVGVMRTLAVELGQHNIRINSVHPTQCNTPLMMNETTYRLFRADLDDPGPDDIAPISQLLHVLPIPWVEPEDISNAALYFASDESRYATGVALPVDAGCCLK